jgi:multidrug efflux pump subunit AcrB
VVNAAIVLLDQADSRMKEGASARQSMQVAVRLRTRPILLTVTTTVAGLLPLALSSSPMWPPMAWAMISGLVSSTVLTLVLVPALYVLLLDRREEREDAGVAAAGAAASPS